MYTIHLEISNISSSYQLLCKPPYNPSTPTPNSIQDQTGSTPTPLPEGYAIVPNVIGLDFYTAGLKLQEAGFEVEKKTQFSPEIPKNEVFLQEPKAGSSVPKSEIVTIFIATDTQTYLFEHINATEKTQTHFRLNLPENSWCETSFENRNSGWWRVTRTITYPDSSTKIGYDFTTTETGLYEIHLSYKDDSKQTDHFEGDFWVWCKPNDDNLSGQFDDDIILLEMNDSGLYSGIGNVSVYIERNNSYGVASIESDIPQNYSCQISLKKMSRFERYSNNWISYNSWYGWDLSGSILSLEENTIGELSEEQATYLITKHDGLHTISVRVRNSIGRSLSLTDNLFNVQVSISCEQGE